MFQCKSTVTAQQQEVLQEDEELEGRLRHVQTRHLWLQSRVALGHLKLDVVAGEKNPADTLTKPLPGRKIREWSEHVGQRWLQQSQQQQMMENIVKDAW